MIVVIIFDNNSDDFSDEIIFLIFFCFDVLIFHKRSEHIRNIVSVNNIMNMDKRFCES